jgi:hypothetical protein
LAARGIYYLTRRNGVWHAEGFNNRLQAAETYEAVNNTNSPASMLSYSCLNWGVNPNYGNTLYPLCPVSSGSTDNGTLQSGTYTAGGPGYPQFLSMTQTLPSLWKAFYQKAGAI